MANDLKGQITLITLKITFRVIKSDSLLRTVFCSKLFWNFLYYILYVKRIVNGIEKSNKKEKK